MVTVGICHPVEPLAARTGMRKFILAGERGYLSSRSVGLTPGLRELQRSFDDEKSIVSRRTFVSLDAFTAEPPSGTRRGSPRSTSLSRRATAEHLIVSLLRSSSLLLVVIRLHSISSYCSVAKALAQSRCSNEQLTWSSSFNQTWSIFLLKFRPSLTSCRT